MPLSCECCGLSGSGLCDGPISPRGILPCVSVCVCVCVCVCVVYVTGCDRAQR
jgi:hypothetical protein